MRNERHKGWSMLAEKERAKEARENGRQERVDQKEKGWPKGKWPKLWLHMGQFLA